jgi:hypothetical protein
MISKKYRAPLYESNPPSANLDKTPFMNLKNTVVLGIVSSVIAYFFYTREMNQSNQHDHGSHGSTSIHHQH